LTEAKIVFEVRDGRGRPVRLREGQWKHATSGHPEMVGEQEGVKITISDPDIVVRPHGRAKKRGIERRVNCRRAAHSRYKGLYLLVVIDYGQEESWVVTAYVTPLPPKGDYLYVRIS
jgi:hypothetical protein